MTWERLKPRKHSETSIHMESFSEAVLRYGKIFTVNFSIFLELWVVGSAFVVDLGQPGWWFGNLTTPIKFSSQLLWSLTMTSSVGPKFINFHQYEPPRIAYSSSKLCFCFAECFLESLFSTSVWNNILIFFHFSRKEANGVDLLVETRCQLACVFPFPSSMFYILFVSWFQTIKVAFSRITFFS